MTPIPTPGEPGQVEQQSTNAPGSGQGDFDFAHAYNELRPEYTRTTQELSQARESLSEYESWMQALADPSTQAEALAALGFEVDTGSGAGADDEFVDPLEQELEQLRAQVSELQGARELEAGYAEEQQYLEQRDDFVGEAIGLIESQLAGQTPGFQFSEREEEILGNLAIAMENEQGVPDVQGAFDALYGNEGLLETNRQRWIDSKQSAYAAPLGQPIPEDRKPTNARERVAFIDERARALDLLRN